MPDERQLTAGVRNEGKQMEKQQYIDRAEHTLYKVYNRFPVVFDHGEGVKLYDTDGQEYLDFGAGIAVMGLGYSCDEVKNAVKEQVEKLPHISNLFYNEPAINAGEKLLAVSQMDKVFFTNSGAESTEGALKLARKYYYQKHGKADSEIISLNHSFHGRTTGSVKLTGNAHYQEAFGPLIEGVKYANINDLESVKALVNEKTAAIIVEPVQGEGGVYVCSKEFLIGLRILCDEKDIALILDEVQCGMGRTGTIMTYFQYDILPDILCLAKGIGAGFPMGAFVANKKFAAAMEPGDHGSTYGGNPMAGQACRTVFKILEETKMLDHVQDISEYLIEKLDDLKDKYSCIKERRGLGLMIGLEFDRPVKDIVQTCLDNGLIVVMAGANVIRMLPPFITTEKDVDQAIAILDQAIEKNI